MNDEQLLRYSRHVLLHDFDLQGQESLLSAAALIIGAGGLGCPAAMYLASSGIGHLIICDDDVVEMSNLQRQIGHVTAAISKAKVDSLKETLLAINPAIKVTTIHHRLSENELREWVAVVNVVLDCSDNFPTRFRINKICVEVKKPLVSGAAIRAEGQVAVFDARVDSSPCYSCLYHQDIQSETVNCSNNGVLAPIVGVVGSLQAVEAIKIIASYGRSAIGKLLVMDVKNGDWRQLNLTKDKNCHVCAKA